MHFNTELTQLHGDPERGLDAVSWRNRTSGAEEERPVHNVFLFVGADPETEWLKSCGTAFDSNGFVLTGQVVAERVTGYNLAPLESCIPGVFAIGDVRSGSVKRVGGAIGEGAAAVAQIHQYLAVANAAREAAQHAGAVA